MTNYKRLLAVIINLVFSVQGLQACTHENLALEDGHSVKTHFLIKELNPLEVLEAQKLIYHVYVDELKWKPEPYNPSGIHFPLHQDKPYFTDDYDKTAKWFGAFFDNTLVACIRYCSRLNGKLEMERYTDLPLEISSQTNLVELTRSAIHPLFINYSDIPQLLLSKILDELKSHKLSAVVANSYNDNPYLLDIKLADDTKFHFKYDPKDTHQAQLLILYYDKISDYYQRLNNQAQQ